MTLDDGTKVLVAQIRTVNQPKGGKVNVYMAQDGQQYYQYVDANGKQQKVTKTWDYVGATWQNFTASVGKIAEGHPIDGIVQMFSGAEDPRGLSTGETPAVGFAKGSGLLSKLKDIKSLGQLKDVVKSYIQRMKPAKQMKPGKNIPDGLDINMYNTLGKRNIIAQAYRFGNAAERHQGVINAENMTKIVSNLSKTLGKNINPKDLKVVSLANGNKYEFQISYFDNATGKAYCYLSDGTPNMVMEFQYGVTGKIKDFEITSGWLNNSWADF